MESHPPQPLPRLIEADEVLPRMKRVLHELGAVRDNIVQNVNPQTATFDNVIKPLIDVENRTQSDVGMIAMLRYASPDGAAREASDEACKLWADDEAEFTSRSDFFPLVKAVKELSPARSLDAEAEKYVDELYTDFKRSGPAVLDPEQTKQYLDMEKMVGDKKREYNRNIRDECGGIWLSLQDLRGVSQPDLERFEKDPERENMRFVRFSTVDFVAVLENATDAATRRRYYIASANKLSANAQIFQETAVLRQQIAKLLGYESHAQMRLEKRLAKNPEWVTGLLQELEDGLSTKAETEKANLLRLKRKHQTHNCGDGDAESDVVYIWDYWYLAALALRENRIDITRISEYFPLQVVIQSMIEIFQEYLQLRFVPVPVESLEGARWHEDVEAWAVWDDRESSRNQFIGYLYMDLLSRDNKYKGNQNVNLQCGYRKDDGTRVHPVTILMCSFPRSAPSRPALLKHRQVVTLFHELGHGIHDLVSKTSYVHFHGHRVSPDFGEALSFMLENYCWLEPELERISCHFTSIFPRYAEKWQRDHPGEPLPPKRMPKELLQELISNRNTNRALWFLGQMVYAHLDMAAHDTKGKDCPSSEDLTAVYYDTCERLLNSRGPQSTKDRGHPHADFGHLMAGYDAGYYAYLSAHVIAAELFESNFAQSPRSKEAWERYRRGILEFGGSRDEMTLLTEFLGHKPATSALLHTLDGRGNET